MSTLKSNSVLRMNYLAILTAIVIFLQCFGGFLKLPFLATSFNLALIPITIGAILLGPRAGAWLGLVCGTVILIYGVTGVDLFTHLLFEIRPFVTVLICLVKTTVAGFLAGLVYRLLAKRTHWGALFATAATVPIVNTALFILGGLPIGQDIIEVGRQLEFYPEGMSAFVFIIVGCVTVNFFFFELLPNLVLTPAVQRIIAIVTPKKK